MKEKTPEEMREEKLEEIAELYLDIVLAKCKNPETPLLELNDCFRILERLQKMALI